MILRTFLAVSCLAVTAQAQQAAPLAESLPENTLLYLEVPNIPALRDGFASSATGRVWNDEEVQAFVGDLVTMGMAQYNMMQTQMADSGAPMQFMSWEAMKSMEVGLVLDGSQMPNAPGITVAAQIQFADGLAEMAFGMLSGMMQSAGQTEFTETANGAILRVAAPRPTEPSLELQRIGNSLRFQATNLGAVGAATLSKAPAFQRVRAQVLQPGIALFGYYNARASLDMQRSFLNFGNDDVQLESMAESMMAFAESAIGNAEAMGFGSGWKQGRSVTTSFVDFAGQEAGWAYQAAPADRGMVSYIPSDATSFSIASMGGSEGMEEFFASVDGVLGDETMKQNIAIWAEAEPISHSWLVGENRPLLDAALAGFGERVLSYSSPTRGSRTLVELKDPAAVQAAATPLVKTLAQILDSFEELPVALRAKRESPRENPQQTIPVYYLRLKTEALPPEFAQVSMFLGSIEPAFAISPDGWLVISMNRADVRSIIRAGLQADESNILSNPEAKSFLDRAPKGAVSLGWSDPRPGITATMGMVQAASGLLGMNMDPSQMPVDLTKMPSAIAINRHLVPSETVTWRDDEGLKSMSTGSFGMADALALAGYALPAGSMAFMMSMPRAMEAPPLPPVEAVASDPLARTQNELARLQTAILIYELLNDKPPATLGVLLEEGPEGERYIDSPESGLRPDGWGNAYIYRTTTDGFMLYSAGPNGADEGGAGDDVTVDG